MNVIAYRLVWKRPVRLPLRKSNHFQQLRDRFLVVQSENVNAKKAMLPELLDHFGNKLITNMADHVVIVLGIKTKHKDKLSQLQLHSSIPPVL